MDKYEFNIKVEQIKKLVSKEDYDTAMRIADTIDWRRVRNTNLLSLVAQIYEKNEDYREAKDILLLAFERAPVGKRLLYKLSELSLKEHNVEEAEDYYNEFCDLAPEDPRQHLLRYMILKEKRASLDQLIHSLERYTALELDEHWLYELAELYHKAGMSDPCIRICDKIMLMFGLGKYVEKAMDLKIQHAPLNSYQMDLVDNRDKYETKLHAAEQQLTGNPYQGEQPGEIFGQVPGLGPAGNYAYSPGREEHLAASVQQSYGSSESIGYVPAYGAPSDSLSDMRSAPGSQFAPYAAPGYSPGAAQPEMQAAQTAQYTGNISFGQSHGLGMRSETPVAEPKGYGTPEPSDGRIQGLGDEALADLLQEVNIPAAATAEEPLGYAAPVNSFQDHSELSHFQEASKSTDEELIASVRVAEAEEQLAEEMSRMSIDPYQAIEEDPLYRTRILNSIKEVLPSAHADTAVSGPIPMQIQNHAQELNEDRAQAQGWSSRPVELTSDVLTDEKNVIFSAQSEEIPQINRYAEHEEGIPNSVADGPAEAEISGVAASKNTHLSSSVLQDNIEQEADRELIRSHLIIEAGTLDRGLQLALDSLKRIHRETGSRNSVAKIPAGKLNKKGLLPMLQKLQGKDFIIEDAGDLSEVLAAELEHWMRGDKEQRVVVLIDNPRQVEQLHLTYPSFCELFECIGTGEPEQLLQPEEIATEDQKPASASGQKPITRSESFYKQDHIQEHVPEPAMQAEMQSYQEEEIEPVKRKRFIFRKNEGIKKESEPSGLIQPRLGKKNPPREAAADSAEAGYDTASKTPAMSIEQPISEQAYREEQMDIDEFAQYACKYAKEIDCSVIGKSMLALYERIEIMEEEGIPLTRSNAEELIEEAADKAERPSLKRLFTGMFSPKYDKDDYLILKEEHFIG